MGAVVKKITLSKPILTVNGEVSELSFREAEAGDFWNVPMNPTLGHLMEAAGKMCGLLSSEMKKLSPKDMLEVSEFLGEVMPNTPAIGGK